MAASGADGIIHDVLVLEDDTIIIVGDFTHYNDVARNCVARLHADGTIDEEFDLAIRGTCSVPTIAIQSNGKIIIPNNSGDLKRFNADGTVDISFESHQISAVETLAVDSDNSIIVGGRFMDFDHDNDEDDSYLVRLLSDGQIDTGFHPTPIDPGFVYRVIIQPDRKIIVGGAEFTYGYDDVNHVYHSYHSFVRLNQDGTLDRSFACDRQASAHIVFSLAMQKDDKIIFGGRTIWDVSGNEQSIARYDASGGVDNGFIVDTFHSDIYDIAIQKDQKIIIAAFSTSSGSNNPDRHGTVKRLDEDGTVDENFAVSNQINDKIYGIDVQQDGKIIGVGSFDRFNGHAVGHIFCLNADGTENMHFGSIINDEIEGDDETVDAVRNDEIDGDDETVDAVRNDEIDGDDETVDIVKIPKPEFGFMGRIGEKVLSKNDKIYVKNEKIKFKGNFIQNKNGSVKIVYENTNDQKEKIVFIDSNGLWSENLRFKKNKTYKVKFIYLDKDGNEIGKKGPYKVKIDNVDPVFHDIPNKLIKKNGDKIWWEAKDDEEMYEYKYFFNGKIKKTKTPHFFVPENTKKGVYDLEIRAYDKAGNKSIKFVRVEVR